MCVHPPFCSQELVPSSSGWPSPMALLSIASCQTRFWTSLTASCEAAVLSTSSYVTPHVFGTRRARVILHIHDPDHIVQAQCRGFNTGRVTKLRPCLLVGSTSSTLREQYKCSGWFGCCRVEMIMAPYNPEIPRYGVEDSIGSSAAQTSASFSRECIASNTSKAWSHDAGYHCRS